MKVTLDPGKYKVVGLCEKFPNLKDGGDVDVWHRSPGTWKDNVFYGEGYQVEATILQVLEDHNREDLK
jgi:hypothetical protein